jgi:hypothetical protein
MLAGRRTAGVAGVPSCEELGLPLAWAQRRREGSETYASTTCGTRALSRSIPPAAACRAT